MKQPPEEFSYKEKTAYFLGAVEMCRIAERTLADALRNIGLISSCSSMFTGEIHMLAKESLTSWNNTVGTVGHTEGNEDA